MDAEMEDEMDAVEAALSAVNSRSLFTQLSESFSGRKESLSPFFCLIYLSLLFGHNPYKLIVALSILL